MSFSHNIYRNWMFPKTILTHILYRNKCLGPHFHPRAEQALCLSLMLTMTLFACYQSSAVVKYRTFHSATRISSVELNEGILLVAASPGWAAQSNSGHLLLDRWKLAANFSMFSTRSMHVTRNYVLKLWLEPHRLNIANWRKVLNGTVWEDFEFAIIRRNGVS